jgi:hypothetical protein
MPICELPVTNEATTANAKITIAATVTKVLRTSLLLSLMFRPVQPPPTGSPPNEG